MQDKIKADAVDDSMNNPRQNIREYMDDWFTNQYVGLVSCSFPLTCPLPVAPTSHVPLMLHYRYGIGPVSKEARSKFVGALKRYQAASLYCRMFGRLWGIFEPVLDEAWCDYYLEWVNMLIAARAAKDEVVIPVKQGVAFMVRHGAL